MDNSKIPEQLSGYLLEILDQAKNGISITDPHLEDDPLIYINQTFTDLFEYEFDEVVGQNCRFLQGEDRDQSGIQHIRDALNAQAPVTVILRNYTKSGKLVYNEVSVSPIFDKETGDLRYFLGVQKDVTKEQLLLKQLHDLV